MNRVIFAAAAIAASFAAKHYMNKVLEAKFREAIDKKVAEQNAPTN